MKSEKYLFCSTYFPTPNIDFAAPGKTTRNIDFFAPQKKRKNKFLYSFFFTIYYFFSKFHGVAELPSPGLPEAILKADASKEIIGRTPTLVALA